MKKDFNKIILSADLRHTEDYLEIDDQIELEFDRLRTTKTIHHSLSEYSEEVIFCEGIAEVLKVLSEKKIDFVFNICEGRQGSSRESQIPSLLEGLEIPFSFSNAETQTICLNKIICYSLLQSWSLPVPEHCLLLENFLGESHNKIPFPFIVKPVKGGCSQYIYKESVVYSEKSFRELQTNLPLHVGFLVQTFLPGPEFSVAVVGNLGRWKIVGGFSYQLESEQILTWESKEKTEIEKIFLPKDQIPVSIIAQIEVLMNKLAFKGAVRFDFRCSKENIPILIDINTIPGLDPIDSDLPWLWNKLGLDYNCLIKDIIFSSISEYALW